MSYVGVRATIQRNCKFCKRTFNALIGNVRQGKGWYCSKTCSNRGNGLKFEKGHKSYLTPEIYKTNGIKISKSKKGKKFSEEHKKALSRAQIKYRDRIGRKKCKNRDGRRKCYKCIKTRNRSFKRDNFTCQNCNKRIAISKYI